MSSVLCDSWIVLICSLSEAMAFMGFSDCLGLWSAWLLF